MVNFAEQLEAVNLLDVNKTLPVDPRSAVQGRLTEYIPTS